MASNAKAVHIFDANGPETRDEFGVISGAVLLTSDDDYDLSVLPPSKTANSYFIVLTRIGWRLVKPGGRSMPVTRTSALWSTEPLDGLPQAPQRPVRTAKPRPVKGARYLAVRLSKSYFARPAQLVFQFGVHILLSPPW
jgi:hypothetical protein